MSEKCRPLGVWIIALVYAALYLAVLVIVGGVVFAALTS